MNPSESSRSPMAQTPVESSVQRGSRTDQDDLTVVTEPKLIWIRSKDTGRLEREVFGWTPFDQVPSSPYYSPAPGWWGTSRAWLDEDGMHVVFAHDCDGGLRDVHILPWPTWQALPDGSVSPSYSCEACGLHTFARIEWAAL